MVAVLASAPDYCEDTIMMINGCSPDIDLFLFPWVLSAQRLRRVRVP